MYSSHSLTTKPDGLGGARTLRGILRNRVTGDGVAFGNVELRWKFYKGYILKQHIQLGINAFMDGGMMVQPHKITMNTIPPDRQTFYFSGRGEQLHLSAGLGFRIILDDNFIIAIDYGRAFDPQDGIDGLYIGVGNIF
jgi:hemolysin activation/secretion protein